MGVPSLTLEALLKDIAAPVSAELAAVAPADVVLDSRLVKAGDLFVAVPGVDGDGRHFVEPRAECWRVIGARRSQRLRVQ